MEYYYRVMNLDDYETVYNLWASMPGIGLSQSDSRENIAFFLAHNERLSWVALAEDQIIGAVLCGHDGRRGYLHHLAVEVSHRRRGVARALLKKSLARLAELGITKCNIFVFKENAEGQIFWLKNDWVSRSDLLLMQQILITSA